MVDLRLVICVAVVALAAVEARSVIGCGIPCKYGLIPGKCRCRPQPILTTNTCAVRFCPINTRCVPTLPVAKCVPVDVCRQPKDPGPCEALIPRYFYNSASRSCEKFFYGGCLGNGNNFQTLRDCNSRCSRSHSYY